MARTNRTTITSSAGRKPIEKVFGPLPAPRPAILAILALAALSLALPLGLRAQTVAASGSPIQLEVDATQAAQKILHAHMRIPVAPGPLTLYYPKWIPGEHEPDGPIINVAGLKFTANGATLTWRRDLVDMFAIHLTIPAGATELDADLDFLLSAPATGFSAGASATANLVVLSWNQVALYPSGTPIRQITFAASLKIPTGWQFGTALPVENQDGGEIHFTPVTLNTLVDSPVLAGRYFRKIQLTPGEHPSHEMDIASDNQASLAMTPDMQADFHQLVAETGALFGVRHYRDYHFLLTLSDDVAHFGLEHHESSDDRTGERSLIDDPGRIDFAQLLPHEFVHSWNGKYRRPAGLATPDYQQPMKDDLLWVYEGLTEYLGDVLTARSGLLSDEQSREALAVVAATLENRPGRDWRSLQDTADAAPFLYDAGTDWSNWRRGTDFYEEGELLWLDVDSTLRKLTNDKKSMNDFCRAFYAGAPNEPALKTYTFDDVVAQLNAIAPYNWAGFLRTRLDAIPANTPTEAIANSGWKLVYNDEPNTYMENVDEVERVLNLRYSIGLLVNLDDGSLLDVIHGSPAYAAGLAPGMKITAVNGEAYSADALSNAVDSSKSAAGPMHILAANGSHMQVYSVDYHGERRYPHLERDNSRPDYLSEIYRSLAGRD